MNCPNRVWIVFASQTGKSERISYEVRDQLWKIGVIGYPTSIDQFEEIFFDYFEDSANEFDNKLKIEFPFTIFILSTTGQGDVPDTMMSFWNKFLTNNFNSILIKKFNFTIFGLGDRCFGNSRFNITARKLRYSLLKLGAIEKISWALGDESHDFGLLGEFDPWLDNIVKMYVNDKTIKINDYFMINDAPYKYKCEIINNNNYFYNYYNNEEYDNEYELLNALDTQKDVIENLKKKRFLLSNISSVVYNEEYERESKSRRIKHIKLGLFQDNRNIEYRSGSHIAIWPTNSIDKVLQFIELFNKNINPKLNILIKENDEYYKCLCNNNECIYINNSYNKYIKCYKENRNHYIPLNKKMTIFTLLYRYMDIMNMPDRRFIYLCYKNSNDDLHKKRLNEMIQRNVDSKKDYCDYVRDEHRNFIELLWDFNSIELSIEDILHTIPIIIPRYYSICNAPNWYNMNIWKYINYKKLIDKTNNIIPDIISYNLSSLLTKTKIEYNNNNYLIYKKMKNKIIENYLNKNNEKNIDEIIIDYKDGYINNIDLCIDIIEWNTAYNRKIRGLCSSFIDGIIPNNNKILIAFDRKIDNMILNNILDLKTPILLISCGLGITGIISILQERIMNILLNNNFNIIENKLNCFIYIGMRYSNILYPFIDQIYEFSTSKDLNHHLQINIAYSRKNPDIKESIFYDRKKAVNINHLETGCYIQSLLLKDDNIDNILNCILNGYIIVCGNALTMPIEIRETLSKILLLKNKFETIEDSMFYIKKLIKCNRYIEETWI